MTKKATVLQFWHSQIWNSKLKFCLDNVIAQLDEYVNSGERTVDDLLTEVRQT